jgi:glycosyltransferase involved in cell wall biosynthesis
MWCGCPVIVSNRSSLPEVCGGAVLYCDPAEPATIAGQLKVILESPSAREDLREAGRKRAAEFSWGRAAREFIEIMESNFSVIGM